MRHIDKLRRAKRTIQVQSETLDEYRNTIKFLEAKVFRLENELSELKQPTDMEVSELNEKIREVYKLINYRNSEFEWNDQLREARKILNDIQSKLR